MTCVRFFAIHLSYFVDSRRHGYFPSSTIPSFLEISLNPLPETEGYSSPPPQDQKCSASSFRTLFRCSTTLARILSCGTSPTRCCPPSPLSADSPALAPRVSSAAVSSAWGWGRISRRSPSPRLLPGGLRRRGGIGLECLWSALCPVMRCVALSPLGFFWIGALRRSWFRFCLWLARGVSSRSSRHRMRMLLLLESLRRERDRLLEYWESKLLTFEDDGLTRNTFLRRPERKWTKKETSC